MLKIKRIRPELASGHVQETSLGTMECTGKWCWCISTPAQPWLLAISSVNKTTCVTEQSSVWVLGTVSQMDKSLNVCSSLFTWQQVGAGCNFRSYSLVLVCGVVPVLLKVGHYELWGLSIRGKCYLGDQQVVEKVDWNDLMVWDMCDTRGHGGWRSMLIEMSKVLFPV